MADSSPWVIGYGFVQAAAPRLWRGGNRAPGGRSALGAALILALCPAGIAVGLAQGGSTGLVLVLGLLLFGVVFAVNSSLHSYLVLAYSDAERVSMNVGFYYMANAGGRLAGTLLSGWIYQVHGLAGCLWWSTGFVLLAAGLSVGLPSVATRR